MKKLYRIAPEIREQILRRIKEEGISVEQAAEAMAVQTLIGGKSIIETLKNLLEGTPLAVIMGSLAQSRDGNLEDFSTRR